MTIQALRKLTWLLVLAALPAQSWAKAKEHVVVEKDNAFSKSKITVKPGDSITFKNEEKTAVLHNVYTTDTKNAFPPAVQEPGKSTTVEFKEEGSTHIECAIHPGMKIDVTVKK